MKINFRIYILILAFFAGSVQSQNLLFRNIKSDDGLSVNLVNSIYQDSKGFMWFGTQDGLNKYDGFQIKVYKNEPNNQNSISYSEVNCINETSDNKLLIGTPSGLNFLDLTNDSVTRIYFNTKDLFSKENYITTIKKLDDQIILVGTSSGLFQVDTKTKGFKEITFNSKKSLEVKDILIYNKSIYVATAKKGVWTSPVNPISFNKMSITDEYLVASDLSDIDFANRLALYAGKLYLGTDGSGIFRLDPSTGAIEKQIRFGKTANNERNYIKALTISGNEVFCGTNDGLITYNLLTEDTAVYVKRTGVSMSISDDKITDIFIDSGSNIWVGTFIGGVNISFKSAQKFVNHPKYKTEKYNNLFLTFQDNEGNIWLSGDSKLWTLPANSGQFTDQSSISGRFDVLCAIEESKGVYWFGTYGGGLIQYEKNGNKVHKYLSEEMGGTVLCVKKINNYLLIATYGEGLFKMDLTTHEIKHYNNNEDGLEAQNLTSIYIGNDKTIWLLSDGGGAINIKDFSKTGGKLEVIRKFEYSLKGNSIATDAIYSMNEDINGNLWFGTSNGLSRYNSQGFKNFYESDGLANTFIYSILKDSTGKFWMSTNKGITAFNPTESNKPFFKNYTKKDGLVNSEHIMGAACFSTKGNMLFGGPNGYTIFRPSQIKDNLKVPNIYITSFKRAGKDIVLDSNLIYKRNLKLSWRENYFQMEMVALDFIEPGKNLYKYKLNGYDENWSEPSNVRYLSYTELPGGTYTLQIKGSNSDGVWNETPYELVITIVPPFWKTKWFYFVVIVLGTGIIILYTQWRTKQIKKENKVLENKVAERTKELAEKNRDITSSIEYAKRIQEAILPPKDLIFSKLKKAFILYKPKDIVSGDFYWFGEKNGWKICGVVDCTGHGVPGAFMSMIGHNLLNQIVLENGVIEPGKILNALHKGVQEALRQGTNEIDTNDGMDVSLIAINEKNNEIKWAGANRPLVLIYENAELIKLDGNKYPIGGSQFEVERVFTTHTVFIDRPVMLYMFSDGYADQFGGESGKKFMVRRFNDLLKNIYNKGVHDQQRLLNENFESWKTNHEQIDDVLVVGIGL